MTRRLVRVATAAVVPAAAALVAACGAGPDEAPAPEGLTAAQRSALAVRVQALVPRVSAGSLGYELRWGAARRGTRAQVDTERRIVWVFARRADTPHRIAHDLAHELGHAYDQQRMSEAARREYLVRRGRPDAAWWPERGRDAYAAGAEDFAEVFALCHAASPEFRSHMARRPDAPCRALPRAAAGDLQKETT